MDKNVESIELELFEKYGQSDRKKIAKQLSSERREFLIKEAKKKYIKATSSSAQNHYLAVIKSLTTNKTLHADAATLEIKYDDISD